MDIIRPHNSTRLLKGVRPNVTFPVFAFAASEFKSSTCTRSLPHISGLPPSLTSFRCSPQESRHTVGSCGCRCGGKAKDGNSFLCCQRALPHPVLCLPSHALPATSCVLDCPRREQTSASFTANVTLYKKEKQKKKKTQHIL